MTPDIQLIIHNVLGLISGIIAIILAIFVLFRGQKRTAAITLALGFTSVAVFYFSHIIGVSLVDPNISRMVLMFNICIIFIVLFNLHSVFSVIGMNKRRRVVLIIAYTTVTLLTLVYILFPRTFMLDSVPKMYFPNYYVPGSLHWIMRVVFNIIFPSYFMGELIFAYRKTTNTIERGRFLYFFFASIVGYSMGLIPVLLVYNIPVDPVWGMPFIFFYALPLTYAIVKYELLDIRIIAKKAFAYAVAIAGVGSLIALFDISNRWLNQAYPKFPFWITPLVSAILAVTLSVLIWRRLREGDLLKYEFITTITHKFRTPLTHIKWSSDNLLKSNLGESEQDQLRHIQAANSKLVELTNLLIKLPETESEIYSYQHRSGNIANTIQEVVNSLAKTAEVKNITIEKKLKPEITTTFDEERIKFVIQVLIENAIHYTPNGGLITISVYRNGKNVVYAIKDNGIGISKENMSLLFSKFYRGDKARTADTEGMGIGLYVAKEIIARHHGKIWAESAGLNKGSIFYFSLPAIN